MTVRCEWCGTDPLYVEYHDCQWGVPVHDDRLLFEMLVLEGAQAGLSWITILRKRKNYRKAMHGFDLRAVADYGDKDVARLLGDPGIVRNRLKIRSAIRNAGVFLDIQDEYGSFDAFIWRYVDGTPITNRWRSVGDIPVSTGLSDRMSKDLKALGCNFVGSTICYSFMQAVGMVNDHVLSCFRHQEIMERSGATQPKRSS